MFRRIEIKGLRALRYVDVHLSPFQVVVGPNASGKSTLFDAISLVHDLLNMGVRGLFPGEPRAHVRHRTDDPIDFTWMRQGGNIEIALTVDLPQAIAEQTKGYQHARYEITLAVQPEVSLANETLWLLRELDEPGAPRQSELFPDPSPAPGSVAHPSRKKAPSGWRKVVSKTAESGNDYFRSETGEWNNMFRLGPGKAALANLPEDEERFPAATWFKRLIMEADGVRRIALNPDAMRMASPPALRAQGRYDGSDMAWRIRDLETSDMEAMREWIDHLRTGLPDLETVYTREREDDRACYVVLRYSTGLEAPSWVVSEGTLRLLYLTLLGYLAHPPSVILVEEPENGIHPHAIETVFQTLSSMSDTQVFCATHAPAVLAIAEPGQLLCFGKASDGAVDIVRGDRHPGLADWQGTVTLGDLFAAGVLS